MFDRYHQEHALHPQVSSKAGARSSPDSNAASRVEQPQPVISQPSPIRGATFGQMDMQPPLRTRSTPPTADNFQQPRFTPHKSNGPTMGPMPSAYVPGLSPSSNHGFAPMYAMPPDLYSGYAIGHSYMHNTYLQQQQAQRMPIHQPTKRASKALQIVDPATGKPIVLDVPPDRQKVDVTQASTPKTTSSSLSSRPIRVQSSPINSALVLSCASNSAGYSKPSNMTPIPPTPLHGDVASETPPSATVDQHHTKDASKLLKKIDISDEAVQLQNSAPPIDSSSVKASAKLLQHNNRAPTTDAPSGMSRSAISPMQSRGDASLKSSASPMSSSAKPEFGIGGVGHKSMAPAETPSAKSKHSSLLLTSPPQLNSPDSPASTKSSLPTSTRDASPTLSQSSIHNQLDNIPEIVQDHPVDRLSPPAKRAPSSKIRPSTPHSEYTSDDDDDADERLSADMSEMPAPSFVCRYTVDEMLSLQKAFEEAPAGVASDCLCLKQNLANAFSSHGHSRNSDSGHRGSRSHTTLFRSQSHGDSHPPSGSNRRLSFRDDSGGGDRHGDRRHERSHHRRSSHKSSAKEIVRHEEPAVQPLQKSETRWVPRQRAVDEEEMLRRKVKAVLNKLTLDKFDTLSKQFLDLVQAKVSSVDHLKVVVELIFDKALSEPTFVKMYSSLCVAIAESMPEFPTAADNGSGSANDRRSQTFKRLLLNQCQQEFERGTSFEVDSNLVEKERDKSFRMQKNRFLGNVRFIGELFKDSMLAERIMHTCIYHFLQEAIQPMEEDIEALCKLLATIGKKFDRPQAKSHIDSYFNRMQLMSTNKSLSRRARFMLMDAIDLRKSGWKPRRKEVEAKTIDEFRQDLEREAAEQTSRSLKSGTRFDSFVGRGSGPKSSNQGW